MRNLKKYLSPIYSWEQITGTEMKVILAWMGFWYSVSMVLWIYQCVKDAVSDISNKTRGAGSIDSGNESRMHIPQIN